MKTYQKTANSLSADRRVAPAAMWRDGTPRAASGADAQTCGRVAYIMSRFPKITETFVLCEILAVERAGRQAEVYPLLRKPTGTMHPEAEPIVRRAHYAPFFSWRILRSNLHYLRRRPAAYVTALATLLCKTWGSANYLLGGLAVFPKVVAFARSMESEGVSHVHAHFCNHPAAAAYVIHQLTDIPYSFTAHGTDLHRDRHMLREKVRDAEFVVTISQHNRDLIATHCGDAAKGKVHVIHCGVDTREFCPTDRGAEENADRGFVVVCVGTLHEVKGQRYLIEACRQLRERGVPLYCRLVGDGVDRAPLGELVRDAGLSEAIRFHGACTRAEVAELIRHADVAVAPSVPTASGQREGIPVALMEAMGCGVPVVASRLSGIPELVEHERSGLLTPPRAPEAIAAALQQLYENPSLRRRLGSEGRRVVERDFNLHANAKRLSSLFCTATPEPRRDKTPRKTVRSVQ